MVGSHAFIIYFCFIGVLYEVKLMVESLNLGSNNGRIFMGGEDGGLYELRYL